jgi:hypothetical protein
MEWSEGRDDARGREKDSGEDKEWRDGRERMQRREGEMLVKGNREREFDAGSMRDGSRERRAVERAKKR